MSACPEETHVDMEDTTEKVVDKVAMDVVDIVYLFTVCVWQYVCSIHTALPSWCLWAALTESTASDAAVGG